MKMPPLPIRILKRWLPWHLRQTLGWARYYHAKRKPPFEGVYSDFGDSPEGLGWRSKAWSAYSREHATKVREGLASGAIPDGLPPSKALLPVLAAACRPQVGPLRVLDFGGAAGIGYGQFLACLGNPRDPDIRYHVVDVPEACEVGRVVWNDDARVTFSPAIPVGEPFDIVFSDGGLHMARDTGALLDSLAATRPAFMLFCKVAMHEGPPFVRRQVNMGSQVENLQWVLGLDELVGEMVRRGYAPVFRGYGDERYNTDNYPPSHRAERTYNLLFRREAGADARAPSR